MSLATQNPGLSLHILPPEPSGCDHSYPTSDFNSLACKNAECLATKKLWNYFYANKDRGREVYRIASRRGCVRPKPYRTVPPSWRI